MVCPNCGANEPHFVPPCFGDVGFFTCHDKDCASKGEKPLDCNCHLSRPIPESRPRGPAPLAQLQLDTIALQVHPMIGTDSDLRREIGGKMLAAAQEADTPAPYLDIDDAVSVAVGGIKAERGRCDRLVYDWYHNPGDGSLEPLIDAIRNPPTKPTAIEALRTMSDEARRICKSESVPQGPTEPPREEPAYDEHGQPCDMARNECGCGTTGCTECWPREERCPTCDETREAPSANICLDLFHSRPQKVTPCDHKFIDSKCCLKCGWTP